jgi:tetratricopeptide (TPR) repeat protein
LLGWLRGETTSNESSNSAAIPIRPQSKRNAPMSVFFRIALTSLAAVGWLTTAALVADCRADDAAVAKHRAVAQTTLDQLLSAMPKPTNYDSWPPKLTIVENLENNAFASLDRTQGKVDPVMVVYTGEIEHIAQFNSDVLAFTIGHELGHLALGHVLADGKTPPSEIVSRAFTRQQEIDADHYGMELALKANFTRDGIITNLTRSSKYSSNYTSYEGLFVDHPTWTDRIALLDKDRANLWRSMSAFNNGVLFLTTEQYANAQLCFERIVHEFPDVAEAWANLGYARLMQYCDALEPDDVRRFDLGQIVIGGFYRRTDAFEQPRQIAKDLWGPAVEALEKAIKLNPKMILAKGNLAIAYMVCPDGKNLEKATVLFTEIDKQLNDPAIASQVDAANKLALLINAGVARAEGANDSAAVEKLWDELATQLKPLADPNRPDPQSNVLGGALDFNRATALAKSGDAKDRQSAEDLWADYLTKTPMSAVWWPLAYDRYVAVCKDLGAKPKTQDELAAKRIGQWRSVGGLPIDDKRVVTLGASPDDLVAMLGQPDSTVTLIKGSRLKKLNYDSLGMSLLVYDGLLAIMLHDAKSPQIEIHGSGLASAAETVSIGMSREEFEKQFGGARPFGTVDDPAVVYRFYQELGLAVRFKGGKVVELVIAPLSRTSPKD